MNLYKLKRFVLAPWVWRMRRKERHQTGFVKGALEASYYRPSMYRFIGAMMEHPDILFEAPLDAESVVVDVGAHHGEWAASMLERYNCKLVLFEPDPESLPHLARRFDGNPKVRRFECGLHDRDATLWLKQRGMGSTVFDEGPEVATGRVQVALRDAAAVLDELGVASIDLVKLNIEGGEYDVLERLIASGWMPRIKCVLVQFHEWRDGAHMRRWRIRRALRRTHRLEWDYAFVWEKWVAV